MNNSLNDFLTRAFVGFGDLYKLNSENYPPYEIRWNEENTAQIAIAVAGFRKEQITVSQLDNRLSVTGKTKREKEADPSRMQFAGIARRDFRRSFLLDESMKVTNVNLEDGILTISLQKVVPEAEQPIIFDIT